VESALRAEGRFNVIVAMRSLISKRTTLSVEVMRVMRNLLLS
jgi:hypothetical protein